MVASYEILLKPEIYGEHNSVDTIESCYVRNLKKDIST